MEKYAPEKFRAIKQVNQLVNELRAQRSAYVSASNEEKSKILHAMRFTAARIEVIARGAMDIETGLNLDWWNPDWGVPPT